jgi:predicted outer membrane repeat protein
MDYTPRQDGTNGNFITCELYISNDGENWALAGTGTNWANDAKKKTLALDAPVKTQYVKVVGKVTTGNFGSASMIEFYENTALKDKAVVSISVGSNPTKTEYVKGQSLDLTGLVVKAVYDDGSEGMINVAELEKSDVDLSDEGEKTVTLTYNGMTAEFKINVVGSENCEAYIGDMPYLTFTEAYANAVNNDVIALCKDITLTGNIAVNKTVTIESKDNTITVTRGTDLTSSPMFTITSGSLTLENIVIDGGAVWENGNNTGITASDTIVSMSGGTLVLGKGGVLTNNHNNGKFPNTGGAVSVTNVGTIKIDGGSIINNKSETFGGVAYLRNGSKFTIEDGSIIFGNVSKGSGGAICADHTSVVTMNGGVIENNTANGANGGAVWVSNGSFIMNGGTVRNNKADKGGFVYINGTGNVTLNGAEQVEGELGMATNKVIAVNGDLNDSDITIGYTSTPDDNNKVATLGKNADAISTANVFSVDGYNNYVKDSGLYITTADLTGDVNMDGSADKSDVALLIRFLMNNSTEICRDRADVNGDGNVDMLDTVALLKAKE